MAPWYEAGPLFRNPDIGALAQLRMASPKGPPGAQGRESQWEKKGGQHVQSHGEEKPVLHSPADCLIQNKYGHASVKLYSWTLKIEFHLIFTYHKILLFFYFFQPFTNVKTILSSRVIQKHPVSRIWTMDRSLPTPGL